MSEEAPFLYLEDLEDPRTLSFIRRHARRLRRLLGELPEQLLPTIMEGLGALHVLSYNACYDRVYVVARDSSAYRVVELPGGRVVREEDGVIVGVYPAPDCSLVGILSTTGSDFKRLEIVSSRGEVVDETSGYIDDVAWRNEEEYYYVEMMRGGPVPSERVIARNLADGSVSVAWSADLPGPALISLHPVYEEDTMLVTVAKGWSEARLYAGSIRDPSSWRLALDPRAPLKPLGVQGGSVYALTYDDPAGTGRVVEIRGSQTRTLVEAHPRFPIEYGVVVEDRIYLVRLVHAKARVEIYSLAGGREETVEPNEPSSLIFPKRWGDKALVMKEAFTQPLGLYELPHLRPLYAGGPKLKLLVEEGFSTSMDGTPVHYFEVSLSGGEEGAVVYGYGGFGVSLDPRYVGYLKPLLEEDTSFVMANLRGGREYGEAWHRAGKGLNKKNVLLDYAAVLQDARKRRGWAAGWGASNGGLLVGAVLVWRPELMNAALIGYPVLDMLRFHELHIGSLWIDEYGDPRDPSVREYLRSYSPLHNVKKARYPPTLVYTGLRDDRVHPGHALRFVAALESVGAPVYLRVDEQTGHMGGRIAARARELADIEAFILVARRGLIE